jgi:hypothetical protein
MSVHHPQLVHWREACLWRRSVCGDRLAVHRTGTLKDILGTPVLGEVEAVVGASNVDAEEEAEGAHVPNGEFSS